MINNVCIVDLHCVLNHRETRCEFRAHETSRMDELIPEISFITNKITRSCFLGKGLKVYSNLSPMVIFREPQRRGWNILDFIAFNIKMCFNLVHKMQLLLNRSFFPGLWIGLSKLFLGLINYFDQRGPEDTVEMHSSA